jgi:hypothetical protein
VTTDLQVGEIEAWRAWKVEDLRRPSLRSLSVPYTWMPGENTARCFRWERCGLFPMPPTDTDLSGFVDLCGDELREHSCGFYALLDPAEVLREYGSGGRFNGRPIVLGRVALWGRVIEGVHGYRGEVARPLSLCRSDSGLDTTLLALGDLYGLPLVEHPCPEEVAA